MDCVQHNLWREISQGPGSSECCNCSLQRAPASAGHNGMTFSWLQTSINVEPWWSVTWSPLYVLCCCHSNYLIQVFLMNHLFLIYFFKGRQSVLLQQIFVFMLCPHFGVEEKSFPNIHLMYKFSVCFKKNRTIFNTNCYRGPMLWWSKINCSYMQKMCFGMNILLTVFAGV